MNQGFSLAEVLVSLLLTTGISLVLLKQQWHVTQLFNQIRLRTTALDHLDNASERVMAGLQDATLPKPFQLNRTQTGTTILLKITWAPLASIGKDACALEHQVSVR